MQADLDSRGWRGGDVGVNDLHVYWQYRDHLEFNTIPMKNTVACIQPSLAAVLDGICSTIRLYGCVPKALAI